MIVIGMYSEKNIGLILKVLRKNTYMNRLMDTIYTGGYKYAQEKPTSRWFPTSRNETSGIKTVIYNRFISNFVPDQLLTSNTY